MTQLMRPIDAGTPDDIANTGNQSSGTSGYAVTDGTSPDTGNWWYGSGNATNALEVLLTDLSGTPPGPGTCTVTVYQAQATPSLSPAASAPTTGGTNATFDVQVREGSTLIAESTGNSCNEGAFVAHSALTFASSAVSDWSDVRIRVISYGTGGARASRRSAAISYIAITTPDAAGVAVEANAGSFTVTGHTLSVTTANETGVPLDRGTLTLSGFDLAVDQSDTLAAGSYTLTGRNSTVSGTGGVSLNAGSYTLTGYSGNESFYLEPSPGTFSLVGYTMGVALDSGATTVSLNAGSYNLIGSALGVSEGGFATLTGTLDVGPEPDEIDYLVSVPFTGTIYWVVTASSTPPALQASPPGFASSGLANGSFAVTSGAGTATADLSAVTPGAYYMHSVGYRTSDAAFTDVATDFFFIPLDLAAGTFSLSGYSLGLEEIVELLPASYVLTGHNISIEAAEVLLNAGSYTLSGFGVASDISDTLGVGSFTLSGFDATLSTFVDFALGAYTLTGYELVVESSARSALATGSFSLTGNSLAVAANTDAALNAGSYSLSGFSLGIFDISPPIGLGAGSYAISGNALGVTVTVVGVPNYATPANSPRGGVVNESIRDGRVTPEERGGFVSVEMRSGKVMRG